MMTRPVCALIGAGEGLGQALAAKFSAEGHDVALISRSGSGSEAAAAAVRAADKDASVEQCIADVTKPHTVEKTLELMEARMGPIDVLIYNVRDQFTECEPLDMTYEALEDVFRLEVVGAFAAAKSVLPSMRSRGRGSIFFSSATAAYRGSKSHPLYAIGKFGVRALSQSLAKAYSCDGVHIVHVRLDCDLDVPIMREAYGEEHKTAGLAAPEDVAQAYWLTHLQPRSAWSNEIELRPHTELWTY